MITPHPYSTRLYLQKKISLENAVVAANNKRRFQQLMNLTAVGD
jgi:uncharacterized membrane protein